MPKLDLIPVGTYEGLPCVSLTLDVIGRPDYLVTEWRRLWRVGTRTLMLEKAPWGTPALNSALAYFDSFEETSDTMIWAKRVIDAEQWAASPLWWAMDVGPILCAPRTIRTMVEDMATMPDTPQPSELYWEMDCPMNLQSPLLDELAGRLDPSHMSWIYLAPGCSEDLRMRALRCVSGCSTTWGVRTGGR